MPCPEKCFLGKIVRDGPITAQLSHQVPNSPSPTAHEFLKGIVIGRLTDFLGENLKSVFDLPQYYDEIGAGTKTRLKDDFAKYGLALEDFIINAITPPEEVQKKNR